MSASNTTYMIQRDSFSVIKNKYWYKLTYQPIMDSLTVRFDLTRGETGQRQKEFEYDYDSIEIDCLQSEDDFKVYTVVDKDTLQYDDNGITYIPVTSIESQTFAKYLIGTSFQSDGETIEITSENYLNYIERIIGSTFIDFSISNQIKSRIDNTRNSSYPCDQVEMNYFYQVTEDDED